MGYTSPKEKCFEEAWKEYERWGGCSWEGGPPRSIRFQQNWSQATGASSQAWRPPTWKAGDPPIKPKDMIRPKPGEWRMRTDFRSAQNMQNRYGEQVRRPDLTVTSAKGEVSVVDLKFTRADGTVDEWRTEQGAKNGRLQQEDYNDINRQQNGGKDPYNGDPSLSPDNCLCDDGKRKDKNKTPIEPETLILYYEPYQIAEGVYLGSLESSPISKAEARKGVDAGRLARPGLRSSVPTQKGGGKAGGRIALPRISIPFPW